MSSAWAVPAQASSVARVREARARGVLCIYVCPCRVRGVLQQAALWLDLPRSSPGNVKGHCALASRAAIEDFDMQLIARQSGQVEAARQRLDAGRRPAEQRPGATWRASKLIQPGVELLGRQ